MKGMSEEGTERGMDLTRERGEGGSEPEDGLSEEGRSMGARERGKLHGR